MKSVAVLMPILVVVVASGGVLWLLSGDDSIDEPAPPQARHPVGTPWRYPVTDTCPSGGDNFPQDAYRLDCTQIRTYEPFPAIRSGCEWIAAHLESGWIRGDPEPQPDFGSSRNYVEACEGSMTGWTFNPLSGELSWVTPRTEPVSMPTERTSN